MSLFPRSIYGNDASFTPLFRLLDDFDSYRTEVQGTGAQNGAARNKGGRAALSARAFNPKFDVRETETTYELHGELPGIERENVTIEFTEPQTIVIHGHVERSYQSGTPPSSAGLLENTSGRVSAITAGGEEHHQTKPHKVTVEDEESEKAKEEQGTVAKKDAHQQVQQQEQQGLKEKYWVSERSIGEFSRTFSFPGRVDQDAVSASLKDGVLNISVPKARKHESRRVAIN